MTDSVVKEQYERYIYARDNGHTKFLQKAERCDAFYCGDQWNAADKAKLNRQRRPALTMNKTLPSVSAIQGQQASNRNDVSFRPKANGTPQTAMALDKTWLHVSSTNKLDQIESDVFTDGIITSRGFYDARMCFKDNIHGDIKIQLVNPYNVVLDPDSEEYEPEKWKEVWVTKWFSLDDIERMYGEDVAGQLKGKTQSQYQFGYDFIDKRYGSFGGSDRRVGDDVDLDYRNRRRFRVLERQHRVKSIRSHFVDMISGETRVIPQAWDEQKIKQVVQMYDLAVIKRPYEEIHWVVTIDDVLAHNETSPYRGFTIVPYFPFFRHGVTSGIVEHLIDPQELYNKTKSQELHVINSTANGGWQGEEGQLANMTEEELEHRGAETGLVVMRKPGTPELTKIQPNQVPTGLDRISFQATEDLKEISMASDSLRGFDREDVAAKAIMAKQAVGSGNFAMPLENLQRTRGLLAEKVLDLIQQFYTEPRVMMVTGNRVGSEPEQLTVNQPTPEGEIVNNLQLGEYSVHITTVPARNNFEETQFQQAKELRELGIAIPDHVLVENSNLINRDEVAQSLKNEPSPEQQQLAQLEVQIKQLEAAKMDAETKKIQADAVLSLVRAQDIAEGEENDGELAEMRKMQAESEKFREEANRDLQKFNAELGYKYAELDQRRAEAQSKADLDAANLMVTAQSNEQQAKQKKAANQ